MREFIVELYLLGNDMLMQFNDKRVTLRQEKWQLKGEIRHRVLEREFEKE